MTTDNASQTSRGSINDQIAVPGALMRGGTSRGPFFLAQDLPHDIAQRDALLLAVMGSPHPLQVDGVGGGHPLTSKAGIVGLSQESDIDLDFTFAQLQPQETTVQTTANCGNMLSAAVPFALEKGLLHAESDTTSAVVRTTNTGLISKITVQTPEIDGERKVAYQGDTVISGVAGGGSPIEILFLNTAGSIAPSLYPTGQNLDRLTLSSGQKIEITCIDNGQPLVIINAQDLGVTGNETTAELNENENLKTQLEELRLIAGEMMQLGDVSQKSYPKMTLVSPAQNGGAINTRSFIPHVAHESIGVLAAVTVATAAATSGTVASRFAEAGQGDKRVLTIEHPSGGFDVTMTFDENGQVSASGITRTARMLMDGQFYIQPNYKNS